MTGYGTWIDDVQMRGGASKTPRRLRKSRRTNDGWDELAEISLNSSIAYAASFSACSTKWRT